MQFQVYNISTTQKGKTASARAIQQCALPHWNPKAPCICPSQFKQIKTNTCSKSGKYKKKLQYGVHEEVDYENIT
jgi:hypothetical protein